MEDMLDPETEALDPMLLEESASMVGMLFFQKLGKFSMIYLLKSDRHVTLVMPSWVRKSTEESELIFMLLEDFKHHLKAWVVTSIL